MWGNVSPVDITHNLQLQLTRQPLQLTQPLSWVSAFMKGQLHAIKLAQSGPEGVWSTCCLNDQAPLQSLCQPSSLPLPPGLLPISGKVVLTGMYTVVAAHPTREAVV